VGEKALHGYLVNEIQELYRLQSVNINDKHNSKPWGPTPTRDARAFALASAAGAEVIVRQMLRWVKIEDVGDTEFLRTSGAGRRAPASEVRRAG
jgi:DNA-directed RNA polymerase subunit beta'